MGEYKVACVQIEVGRDVAANQKKILGKLEEAAAHGAKLIVFPESSNCYPGYKSPQEAFPHAIDPEQSFLKPIKEMAAKHRVFVAINGYEQGLHPQVFDASYLLGPRGELIGKQHKTIFFGHENDWMTAGKEPPQVWDTEIGRIGMYICMDGVIPEPPRILALKGAQVLLNALNSGGPDEPDLHIPVRAVENRVWVISANKVGKMETGPASFVGSNQVVTPEGVVAARASTDREEIIYAVIDPAQADDKRVNSYHDLWKGRRPQCYGDFLQPVSRTVFESVPAPPASLQVAAIGRSGKDVLDGAEKTLAELAGKGIRVVVLPELFPFEESWITNHTADAARISQGVLRQLSALAKGKGLYLACSLVEEEGETVFFHTAYLISPAGNVIGRYRKTHLLENESHWAKEGNEFVVVPTEVGRIGLMIGSEDMYPEVARILSFRGADFILHPTSWSVPKEADWIIAERAAENHVSIISANRSDSFVLGHSIILGARQYPTAPHWRVRVPDVSLPAPGETVVRGEIHPAFSRTKTSSPGTDLFFSRPWELYREIGAMKKEQAGSGR